MTENKKGHIYFHSPCFDGIASAVLVWDYLEARKGWKQIDLHPVNYHLKDGWVTGVLQHPAAVVDFLFHPKAEFWADHHETTLNGNVQGFNLSQSSSSIRIYDRTSGSCALLLWKELHSRFGHRTSKYEELVQWADKIDSARYETPEEAVYPGTAALRVSASLAVGDQSEYPMFLVQSLRANCLENVSKTADVNQRVEEYSRLLREGLRRFEQAVKLTEGVVTFDVDGTNAMVSRYAPFLKKDRRNARYSAGIVRFNGGAKITTMRNPWLEFESVPLGQICAKFGGGGHQRVGSILLDKSRSVHAKEILQDLVLRIHEAERHPVSF